MHGGGRLSLSHGSTGFTTSEVEANPGICDEGTNERSPRGVQGRSPGGLGQSLKKPETADKNGTENREHLQ